MRRIAAQGRFPREMASSEKSRHLPPAERPNHLSGVDFLEAADGDFDFIHDLVIEGIENVQGLEVLFQLLGAGGAEDDGADVWIFQ